MKILVVSLLRVGDVLMTSPALRDLRAKYPSAKIHLLVNSQSLRAVPLLGAIDKVFSFERDLIQKSLGEADRPFFEGFDRLSGLVDQLNAEAYDLVINLTHTRLSGYLLSLVDAKTKNGLCIDAQMKPTFGSPWFRFLNDQADLEGIETFHFNDIFRLGMGLSEIDARGPSLKLTQNGQYEALQILEENSCDGPLIAIQPFTSDEKKDWPLASFGKMMGLLTARHPEASFAILAAPFEKERLENFVAELVQTGVKAFLAVTSLEGAAALLDRSDLLITGDTSIKHLASGLGTKILEIALGSSDPFRTGAYRHGSVIVRSREACAPCVHSKGCHRERRFCSEKVPVDAIAMLASEIYSGRSFQLEMVAKEFANDIVVSRVDSSSVGRFELVSANTEFSEAEIARSIDRLCKLMWLSEVRKPMDGVGTEARRHWSYLKSRFTSVSDFEWRHLFSSFESQIIGIEGRLNSLKMGLKAVNSSFENPKSVSEYVRSVIVFREKVRTSPLLGLMVPLLDGIVEDDISPAFTRLRRLHDVIAEIEARVALYRRVITALDQSVESLLEMENP